MALVEEMVKARSLRGLGESHLQKLAALARPRDCAAGEVLFQAGDDAASIFLLLSGQVRLEVSLRDRGPAGIYEAGPGELLGWSPVLGRHAMTATARVTAPARLAVLEVAQVNELIDRDPQFGVAFLRQLALVVSDRLAVTRYCLASSHEHFDSPRFTALREGSD